MSKQTNNAALYATIVAMGGFLFGIDAALISGTVNFIQAEFSLSDLQLGMAVSAPGLGVLVALPFAGWVANRFGRKKAIIIIAFLYLFSALFSALAPTFWILVSARFLGGLAFSSITLASMYIGEISPPKLRGKLVALTQMNIVVGLSAAYFINYLIMMAINSESAWVEAIGLDQYTWRYMLGTELIFALIWLGLLIIIPESPSWYVYKGRIEDAKKVLAKLYQPEEIDHHVEEMQESLKISKEDKSIISQIKGIFSKSMRVTFIIAITIAIAQQATGINAILFYAPTVIEQIGLGTDAAFQQAIWFGVISVIATALSLLLIDRLGRKPMLLGGMIWIVISLGLCSWGFSSAKYSLSSEAISELSEVPDSEKLIEIAGIEYGSDIAFKKALNETVGEEIARDHSGVLLQKAADLNAILILLGLISFIAAFQFSVGPIMWVLFSEIFPIAIRGIAIPFFAIISSLVNWVVQYFFPWQLNNMGGGMIMLTYAIIVTIGLVILSIFLIETKNISIEEIQLKLQKVKK